MGYTHYWTLHAPPGPEPMARLAEDLQNLAMKSEIDLTRDYQDDQPPMFTQAEIRFNSRRDPCETFVLDPFNLSPENHALIANKPHNFSFPGEYLWDFCKTARRDYDVVAAAGLIAMQCRFGNNARISSDGNTAQDEEWRNAVRLYQTTFPERELPAMPGILTADLTPVLTSQWEN